MRPSCPAAMLLDAISVGHEAVLDMAERDFLQDRAGVGGYGGVGGGGAGGSTYKRGTEIRVYVFSQFKLFDCFLLDGVFFSSCFLCL